MFEAVIFDCDGVLIDSEAIVLNLQLELLADRGLIYSRTDYAAKFVGKHAAATDALLKQESRTHLGTAFSDADLDEMRGLIHQQFATRLRSIDGARDSLDAFHGVRAVASNSRMNYLETNLDRTGLADLAFPNVFSIDHVESGKPAPDIYLHAAAAIGAAPEKCLVIEDSITGATAGTAAGMTVWGFLGGGHVWPELETHLREAGAVDIAYDHSELSSRLSAL